MATIVTKRDGSKVPFNVEKIKLAIMAACADAELADEQKETVVQEISSSVVDGLQGKEEVSSTEIKNMILAELDASYPNVSKAWRDYEASRDV